MKTPARKKAGGKKKGKPSANKSSHSMSVEVRLNDTSFRCEISLLNFMQDKENNQPNFKPVNSFHQALLKSKAQSAKDTAPLSLAKLKEYDMSNPSAPIIPQESPTISRSSAAHISSPLSAIPSELSIPIEPEGGHKDDSVAFVAEAELHDVYSGASQLFNGIIDPIIDLSIIAEDEEISERSGNPVSQNVLLRRSSIGSGIESVHHTTSGVKPTFILTSASADIADYESRHSQQASSPEPDETKEIPKLSVSVTSSGPMLEMSSNIFAHEQAPKTQENHTAPLPLIPLSHSALPIHASPHTMPAVRVNSSVSTPDMMLSDFPVPVREDGPSGKKFALPSNSPLRKSLRMGRDASFGPIPPLPANGAVIGKRTSWLQKVRSYDAGEKRKSAMGGLRSSNGAALSFAAIHPLPSVPSLATAKFAPSSKRKSGEMLGDAASGKDLTGKSAISQIDDMQPPPHKLAKLYDSKEVTDLVGDNYDLRKHHHTSGARQPSIIKHGPLDNLIEKTATLLMIQQSTPTDSAAVQTALAAAKADADCERQRIDSIISKVHVGAAAKESTSLEFDQVIRPITMTTPVPNDLKNSLRNSTLSTHPRRLSVSDLVTSYESKDATPLRQDLSKPLSETNSTAIPHDPVFKRLAQDAPASMLQTKPLNFTRPISPVFSLPVMSRPPSMQPVFTRPPVALSAQSSLASGFSDGVFSQKSDRAPYSQDTVYSVELETQAVLPQDDDDSWPVTDKAGNDDIAWTPFEYNKDESLTWSTLPTKSVRDNTARSVPGAFKSPSVEPHPLPSKELDVDMKALGRPDHSFEHTSPGSSDDDDDDIAAKSTINLVGVSLFITPLKVELILNCTFQKFNPRSQSQQSLVSSMNSSQQSSQVGFFGQAAKLVSTVLGGGRTKKSEVKSLQLAAAAAQKVWP